MELWLKQGDEYFIGITAELNGERINLEDVEAVEFYLGGMRKLYPGEVKYNEELQLFMVPVRQEDTFKMPANGVVPLDARVKFIGGNVSGFKTLKYITVYEAISKEVI